MQAKDTVVQEVHAIQNETELEEEPGQHPPSKNTLDQEAFSTGFELKGRLAAVSDASGQGMKSTTQDMGTYQTQE